MSKTMAEQHSPMHLFWIIIISLLIPIIPFILIGELPGEKWLSNTDDNAFLFGITGASLLAADVLLPIPSTIVGTMLGARLDFFSGFVWTWSGLLIGNLIGYSVGRFLINQSSESLAESPTLLVLAVSRPIPVLAEAVTFAAGAGKVELKDFIFVSAFANGIFAAVLTGNGAALNPDNIFGFGLLIPMLLPVIGWLVWKYKFKDQTSP